MNCKRFLCSVFTVVMLMIPWCSAGALSEDELSSPSAILMDADSGKILFEKNAHEQRPCASITKVMTLTLVMEALSLCHGRSLTFE